MNGYCEASRLSGRFFQLIDHVAMVMESQACNHTGLSHSQVCEIFVDTGGIYKRRVTGWEILRIVLRLYPPSAMKISFVSSCQLKSL